VSQPSTYYLALSNPFSLAVVKPLVLVSALVILCIYLVMQSAIPLSLTGIATPSHDGRFQWQMTTKSGSKDSAIAIDGLRVTEGADQQWHRVDLFYQEGRKLYFDYCLKQSGHCKRAAPSGELMAVLEYQLPMTELTQLVRGQYN